MGPHDLGRTIIYKIFERNIFKEALNKSSFRKNNLKSVFL